MTMLIRVIDFETTGLPPGAAVCEVGWCDIDVANGGLIGVPVAHLTDPGRPMPPEARAVHHISDFECAGEPSADSIFLRMSDGADIFAAHNAAFEREFFTGGKRDWICTMKCARRAWPDLEHFGNQYLRYFFELVLDDDLAMPPHRAGPDAYVTAHILVRLLETFGVDQLIAWTAMPLHYPRIPMTAHKGKLWSEVDLGLLSWFLKQNYIDADVKAAARAEIERREIERRP